MAVWDELRITLVWLREERPGALAGYPDPSRDDGGPRRTEIRLAPWAEAEAGELSKRFGDAVNLTVGALPYPPGRAVAARPSATADPLSRARHPARPAGG